MESNIEDYTDLTDFKPLRVLWYDTEQSDESTQDILKNRVFRMIGHTDHTDLTDKMRDLCPAEEKSVSSVQSVVEKTFDVFNVRAVEWKERRGLLQRAQDEEGHRQGGARRSHRLSAGPLLKSRPPSYICPPMGDLDMRGRLPEPPSS